MSTKWTIQTALFVLALGAFAGQTRADEPKSPPSAEDIAKAKAEFGQPGPEHKKLAPLAGKWTYTGKAWMTPGEAPIEMQGTAERKWILNGLFLEERISGTGFGGSPFESIGLLGFDKQAKKYTYLFACNMGTAASNGVGKLDASGKLVFESTCYCPMEQKEITARDEIRFEGKDKIVMESYKMDNGKPVKMMEMISVRQK
jgi:hypothetical protein